MEITNARECKPTPQELAEAQALMKEAAAFLDKYERALDGAVREYMANNAPIHGEVVAASAIQYGLMQTLSALLYRLYGGSAGNVARSLAEMTELTLESLRKEGADG